MEFGGVMVKKRVQRRLSALHQRLPALRPIAANLVILARSKPTQRQPQQIQFDSTQISYLPPVLSGVLVAGPWSRLIRWPTGAAVGIVLSLAIAGVGGTLLLHQPAAPTSCQGIFWPLASASLRLYCAQALANQQTLEDLLAAIDLVAPLPGDHPLRGQINQRIERWAEQILNLAEASFDAGELERAIKFATEIPANTAAYPLVETRIQYWRKVWAQGEEIYAAAEAELLNQDWRRAFDQGVRLVEVDNRYWSQTRFEGLSRRIMAAQVDEAKLGKARRLLRQGDLASLVEAMKLARQIPPDSDLRKTVQAVMNETSRGLLDLAQEALSHQDLATALEAVQKVPREGALGPEAQDFIELAYATSWTWSATIPGLEEAIAQARRLTPNRPLYRQAQAAIAQWQAAIAGRRILEQAQTLALQGSPEALTAAIARASQIDLNNPSWQEAQQDIHRWVRQFQTLQDQPLLQQAEELALRGDRAALVAAIQRAQQISQGRALYREAQSKIERWQAEIRNLDRRLSLPPAPPPFEGQAEKLFQEAQALASRRTPEALAAAIEVVNQVPNASLWRPQADVASEQWAQEILALARLRAGENRAEAIAIARQVPRFSNAYADAQFQIQLWQDPR